jgi:hypothetical protein
MVSGGPTRTRVRLFTPASSPPTTEAATMAADDTDRTTEVDYGKRAGST